MISLPLIIEYENAFPASRIGFAEPDNKIVIEDGNGVVYDLSDMTDAEFLSTIAESKRAGKNLFFERGRKMEPLPPDIDL